MKLETIETVIRKWDVGWVVSLGGNVIGFAPVEREFAFPAIRRQAQVPV